MKKLIGLITIFFFLLGCASTTVIKSNPPGAELYLNGQLKGETPYTYTDRAIAGTTRRVSLKKEGYKDFQKLIIRDQTYIPALIAGAFLLVPLLWSMEYPPEYTLEMEKLK